MVDRIEKIDRGEEYWKIDASAEAYKDKQQQEGEEGSADAFASLSEKTDWKLLFDKSQLWKRNIQFLKEEIKRVIFRKINFKTDPSLLRVDVELKNGEKISPAFLAISRYMALKMKSLKSGETIPESFIMNDNILRITIPENPKLFAEEEQLMVRRNRERLNPELTVKSPLPEKKIWGFLPGRKNMRLEVALTYGVIFLTLILAIGGYFLVKSIK